MLSGNQVEVQGTGKPVSDETTDAALFVRTSTEGMVEWSRERIADALVRETFLERETAGLIAREVEEQIRAFQIRVLTAPLIRELVDAKLLEHGLEGARRMHTRLGMPIFDVEQLLLAQNKENANIPHGPEATNLTLAENIKKEYALLRVFSPAVADAHMRGDLHLHDLGFVDRPYCSGQSLEYVKRFGLNLPHALSIAKPAKHPEVLLAHMVKFSAALQSHFAGAIGWDAVNVFFAPFLVGLSDREVRQLAQILIFEYSQQAVARGGQAIFSDINLYWEIPKHFETVPAVGPGGAYTGKTYADYLPESQRFVQALFDVYLEGDGAGRPFFFPKPLVHITEKLFQTPGHEEFLLQICRVAAEKGNTYFVFDRGETAKISECCRLSFKLERSDLEDAREPWRMRYSALQNVTLNLPRAAYLAAGDTTRLLERLTGLMETAAAAHLEKKAFLERLLALGERGPLALLTMEPDGQPYLRLHRATFLVGMVGLNELVQAHTGRELHESDEALRFGLRVIAHLRLVSQQLGERHGMRFVLEQTPAESTAHRFARLDLRYHPQAAGRFVKGDAGRGEVYYTNSTYLNVGAPVNPIERVRKEGLFHPLIEAGSLTHIWLGEARPSAASLAAFVVKTFRQTQNDQIAFSPEFTTCHACQRTSRGLAAACPACGSEDVDGITRITGYFTRVSSWNKGKRGELTDRFRSAAPCGA
jgi:ribonucleoside-triphosphate reductase